MAPGIARQHADAPQDHPHVTHASPELAKQISKHEALLTPTDSEELSIPDLSASTSNSKLRRKSPKRLAIEAFLDRKLSKSDLNDLSDSEKYPRKKRKTVKVNACTIDGCKAAACSNFCASSCTLPTVDWPSVLQAIATNSSNITVDAQQSINLPNGIGVRVVSSPAELGPALSALRSTMQDGLVGIDLEWRPDFNPGSKNKVALIQLASGTMALLIRICKFQGLNNKLPAPLLHFFSDPALTFVAFSWDGGDEGKMQRTFNTGKDCFSHLIDLQTVSEQLGYQSLGLAALTERILGVALPKNRKISMSNWERHTLTPGQIQYAALDALITGHVFRGLRLWHAFPSPCSTCQRPLGMGIDIKVALDCRTCKKQFNYLGGLLHHAKATGHESSALLCTECGRICSNDEDK